MSTQLENNLIFMGLQKLALPLQTVVTVMKNMLFHLMLYKAILKTLLSQENENIQLTSDLL